MAIHNDLPGLPRRYAPRNDGPQGLNNISLQLYISQSSHLEMRIVYTIRQWKYEVPTQINRAATVRERIISEQIRAT